MGGSGGNGDNSVQSVTYTNLLPDYIANVQGWAVLYLDTAAQLSVNTFVAYTGTMYAGQNQDELDGITAVAARGTSGSPIEASGEAYLGKVFSDALLSANPNADLAYQRLIDEAMQTFQEEVLPGIRDSFAFAFGGSDHNIEEAKAAEKVMDFINQTGRKVYYDDYAKERKSQDKSLDHAIPYGMRGVRDAEMLRAAGVYAREWQQGEYMDAWNQWNENQILPMRNLDILGNAVRTILGTQRTATTKYYKPPAFAQIAGAALAGAGLLKMFSKTTKNNYANPGSQPDTRPIPSIPDESSSRKMLNYDSVPMNN